MNIKTGDIIKVKGDDTKWIVLFPWDEEVTAYCDELPDFDTGDLSTFSFDQIENVQSRTLNPKVGDYISGCPEFVEDWVRNEPAMVNSAQIFEELDDDRFRAHWILEDNWTFPDHFFVIFSKEDISECSSRGHDTSPSCPDGEFCSATEEGREKMVGYSESRQWRFWNPRPYTYEGDPVDQSFPRNSNPYAHEWWDPPDPSFLNRDWRRLKYLPEHWRSDKEVMLWAIDIALGKCVSVSDRGGYDSMFLSGLDDLFSLIPEALLQDPIFLQEVEERMLESIRLVIDYEMGNFSEDDIEDIFVDGIPSMDALEGLHEFADYLLEGFLELPEAENYSNPIPARLLTALSDAREEIDALAAEKEQQRLRKTLVDELSNLRNSKTADDDKS